MVMSNNGKSFDTLFASLEDSAYEIMEKLLTKQELSEKELEILYSDLEEISFLFKNEKYLPKKLTSLLFKLYLAAETERRYLKKDNKDPLIYLVAHLQSHLTTIFGE